MRSISNNIMPFGVIVTIVNDMFYDALSNKLSCTEYVNYKGSVETNIITRNIYLDEISCESHFKRLSTVK